MNDQDRQLLREALSTAGAIGSHGWQELVRWQIAASWGWFIFSNLIFFGAAGAIWALFRWKPESYSAGDMRVLALVACAMLSVFGVIGIVDSLIDLAAPEGAALRHVLAR